MMKRRDALKTMGALAGAATFGKVLPGCGDGDDGPVGITTIVVLMMENRTYDHWLGARKLEGLPGDGLTADMANPNLEGAMVPVYEAGGGDDTCVLDPPHGWGGSREQWNNGANDGFLRVHQAAHGNSLAANEAMQYVTRAHIPATWAIADHYASCDRYFASVMGPTWPNRMYWHTGTSNGIQSNELPDGGFDWPTIYHRLYDKQVPFAYYYGDVPVIAVAADTVPGVADSIFRMEDFFSHAAKGTLAPVVYIDPAFSSNDDHPPHHPILGQQLIASIYTALANSPQWKNCLFLVTYDEHGGFFDHVAPPTTVDDFAATGFDQMGFRVPTVLAGPYVKEGQVISTVYDHCSVLKHIENHFGLDPLNQRVTAANDLTDCLDLDRLERGDWRPPAEIPAIEVDESIITENCRYGAEMGNAAHTFLELPDRFPKKIGHLDRRGHVRDYLYMIGDYLDAHNMGRIRRGR